MYSLIIKLVVNYNSRCTKDNKYSFIHSTDFNNNIIDEAGDENEVWKVAKYIINPKSESEWSMNINSKITDYKCL